MPRRSTTSLTIAAFSAGPRRLEAPPELGGIEAEILRATVGAVALDHFQPQDLRLLCAYARAFSPKFIRLLLETRAQIERDRSLIQRLWAGMPRTEWIRRSALEAYQTSRSLLEQLERWPQVRDEP
jgi:hypothetical protein